ncbi:hypothetical protein TSOC_011356 [Tetrabaena socialis]|uniref:RAP domain-containing protein n=1 Tax=Tetrabaena socialis TaxID=47790 RepID=A0A2J7ZQV4_9CHLO|nr:hypothetical protein TSOC_011356 [Tetrabaena socialis]|eukprot:PNH02652.1 hypothetical protein TSOC_011356 [Tetrabaena socialis]
MVEAGAAEWAARLDLGTLGAAFNIACKLGMAPGQRPLLHRILAILAAAYLPLVPQLATAKSCTMPLWACAKAGYWGGGLAAALLQRLGRDSGALLQEATDQGHANVWLSLSAAPAKVYEALGPTDELLSFSADSLLRMRVEDIGPQACSNVLLACSRLRYSRGDLLHHLTACLAAQPAANHQDVANGLYALGELCEDCGHTPQPQDLRWLLAGVVGRLPGGPRVTGSWQQQQEGGGGGFIPQALSNMLLGCAKLGYSDPALLRPLTAAAGQAARRMNEQALANSLYALGVLGCKDPAYAAAVQFLAEEIQQRLQQQPSCFKPQALSNILYALALLGCKDPAYAPAVQCLAEEVQQRLQQQPGTFNSQNLSNILYALALLGCKGPAYAPAVQCLAAEVQQRLQQQPGGFKSQGLSNVLYALALLQPEHGHQWNAVVKLLAVECKRWGFAGFSAQGVSNSTWALEKLGYRSDQGWFAAAVEAAARPNMMRAFTAQGMSSFWYALALHSWRAASEVLRTQATGQVCANMLWSLATLSVPYHQQLMGVLVKRLEELLPKRGEVNEQDMVNSLWAMAVMGPDALFRYRHFVGQLLRKVVGWCFESDPAAVGDGGVPFAPAALVQLWQVQQELAHADGCRELADILAAAGGAAGSQQQGSLLSAMQRAAAAEGVIADGAMSDLQRQVVSALGRLQQRQQLPAGVSPIASVCGEQQVEGLVGRVDVVVELADGRRVAVEVDGPWHFLANDPHTCDRDGSTQLRDRQLERLFGTDNVVSVPYWEWRDLGRDKGAQERYLLRLMDLEVER